MSMNAQLLVGYAVLWIVLIKALLMRSRVIPPECPRCGQLYERRELGGAVCRCDHD
jgi:transposase-like protein